MSDKDALFELNRTKTWEHSRQMLEGSTIFVQRLHEILHQTKLDVKRRKKHLIHVHQRILLEAVFARNKSASRPPVFLLVMILLDYPRDRKNNSTLWSPLAYPWGDQWPLFRFLKLVILTSSWTRFYCLSREAKSSDCCFDRYKSRARSFRSSCVILCGSLPLVPEYVDSISSKDIDSAEGISWRHFFIWWGKKILINWRCG